MPAHALLNGEPAADAAFRDRACQFGDGLFETLAVQDGLPCLWGYHVQRLQRGIERLGLAAIDPDQLLEEARSVCQGRKQAVLKIIISAGNSTRGYRRPAELLLNRWITCADWPTSEPWSGDAGLQIQECSTRLGNQPLLAGIKHLNRLEQVLARAELPEGIQEGVMYDQQGRPVEGIMSNLMIQAHDRYLTPVLDECGVAGTVRQLLLDNAALLDRPLETRPIGKESLYDAEALFMMNSLLGIRAVAKLGAYTYPVVRRSPALDRLHSACFTFSGEITCND